MKEKNDDLFLLIKSMSRTEKRYFKLDAKKSGGEKQNSYLKLFDVLNGMDEYEENRLRKKLKEEPLLDRLATEKNYLYHAILKSMRNYWSDKTANSKIKEMTLNAGHLLDRSLYEQSARMLRKAKRLAIEYEYSLAVLEINKMERIVASNMRGRDYAEKVKKLVAEKDETWTMLEQEQKYLDYKSLLSTKFIRNKLITDPEKKDLLKKEFRFDDESEAGITSVNGLFHYYWSKACYFQLLGDFDESFEAYSRLLAWWDQHPQLKEEAFSTYITDLANYINACFFNEKFTLIPSLIERIEQANPRSFQEETLVFKSSVFQKMIYYFNIGDLEGAKKMVPLIESGLKKYYLDKQIKSVFLVNLVTLFFLLEDHPSCLYWIEKNIDNKNVKVRQDTQRYIRVFKAICYLDMGDIERFDSACRAAIRYCKATGSNETRILEPDVIRILKKISAAPLDRLNEEYKKFKSFIVEKKNFPNERNSPGLEEYYYWVESKLQKRSMAYLLKEDKKR